MNEELGICELFREEKLITDLVEDLFNNIIVDIESKKELVLS